MMSSADNNDNTHHLLFPIRLHKLLSEAERKGFDNLISWLPCGTKFRIHKPKEFANNMNYVMHNYFGHHHSNSYKTFLRQLSMYRFSRVTDKRHHPDCYGAYYHKYFQRNNVELCVLVTRQDYGHLLLDNQQENVQAEEEVEEEIEEEKEEEEVEEKEDPSELHLLPSLQHYPSQAIGHRDNDDEVISTMMHRRHDSSASSPTTTITRSNNTNKENSNSLPLIRQSSLLSAGVISFTAGRIGADDGQQDSHQLIETSNVTPTRTRTGLVVEHDNRVTPSSLLNVTTANGIMVATFPHHPHPSSSTTSMMALTSSSSSSSLQVCSPFSNSPHPTQDEIIDEIIQTFGSASQASYSNTNVFSDEHNKTAAPDRKHYKAAKTARGN